MFVYESTASQVRVQRLSNQSPVTNQSEATDSTGSGVSPVTAPENQKGTHLKHPGILMVSVCGRGVDFGHSESLPVELG